ncbi:MAG TPA: dTDP-4-amino-4,6-dideoxygalactose transaminase [Candidatus Limivivens intestinipullorum]|uniref:dTDP-4-amino-4,6-dideoxygalactose transaminase n=1 Tax=Candidatus Limivivens intestinipullorum TaxID=2840858 RepID=A0A9D1ETH8_9FIRM|nr:dTDP-4-amino-4,6-dideoxygalactose transaminase [Candidatus Limivivens intestinipullorum]
MIDIDFNVPPFTGNELKYMEQAIQNRKISGDGMFTKKCSAWLSEQFGAKHALLTTSCTHALEMAAVLADIQPGDEVILPSYTFVSTGDAFVQRGARLVFVDIRPDTMNIDEKRIEDAVTERTRAIAVVHYAGVACAMDEILDIAGRHHLKVVEDAAQGVGAWYKDRALGTIGDFGCYSFHETKNYSMGEGGAIVFQSDETLEEAEIIREKGTNRSKFFRGEIDKYTWVNYGSSYLPSDLNAAYLWAQLEKADEIAGDRMETWDFYDRQLRPLAERGCIEQPFIPEYARHNAHMYYIKTADQPERAELIRFLRDRGIQAVFHYVPLHSAPAGRQFGRFHGEDRYTTKESERLLRLPLYYHLTQENRERVVEAVREFYG